MADSQVKQKIHDVLKQTYFDAPGDFVDVSDGFGEDSVELVIVSRKFDGKRMKEKNDLIWSCLTSNLAPEEWGQIRLTVGASPEEVKSL